MISLILRYLKRAGAECSGVSWLVKSSLEDLILEIMLQNDCSSYLTRTKCTRTNYMEGQLVHIDLCILLQAIDY